MNIVIKRVTEIIKKHCPELNFHVNAVSKRDDYLDCFFFYSILINSDLRNYKNNLDYINFSFEKEQEDDEIILDYKNGFGAYITMDLEWELSQNQKINYKPMLQELRNYLKQLKVGNY